MLEVGCGPGALTEALLRWYPNSKIYGIDRDSNFIEFAKSNSSAITYSEDDAIAMSFEDGSFDVTISNTVAEHIAPDKFYSEQYRVLGENGICLVLSARRGINVTAPCIEETSAFENDVYTRATKYFDEINEK